MCCVNSQATVLLLRDEGVLRLDDPVEQWVRVVYC